MKKDKESDKTASKDYNVLGCESRSELMDVIDETMRDAPFGLLTMSMTLNALRTDMLHTKRVASTKRVAKVIEKLDELLADGAGIRELKFIEVLSALLTYALAKHLLYMTASEDYQAQVEAVNSITMSFFDSLIDEYEPDDDYVDPNVR